MTDIISEMAREERARRRSVQKGESLYCPICMILVTNTLEGIEKHLSDHSMNEIIKSYSTMIQEIWSRNL